MKRRIFQSVFKGFTPNISLLEKYSAKQILEKAKLRMGAHFKKNQVIGRKGAIGCVSLEISQRCNLNCSLCYLSPLSNQVIDLPLKEVLRRLDGIKSHFGVGTNVQISGGDPTLRNRKELMQIVRYAREIGLLPALFTNGILCSRDMLEELVQNGLSDVAFHVDLTQGRKGFNSEKELNQIRKEYIDRARGLPLMVIFNTTVHKANFSQIPDLVRFFIKNADVVGFASFQLQADTGRSILGKREEIISLQSVKEKINKGANNLLGWDAFLIGHPKCHSYAPTLAVNGKAVSIIDDSVLTGDFLEDFKHITHDRRESSARIAWSYLKEIKNQPRWLIRGLKYFLPRLWNMRKDIIAAKGRLNKISFFVQNFMDANHLDQDRIDACSFMVMTPEGPMSMCAHNANRDEYILSPISVERKNGSKTFYPLKQPSTVTPKEVLV